VGAYRVLKAAAGGGEGDLRGSLLTTAASPVIPLPPRRVNYKTGEFTTGVKCRNWLNSTFFSSIDKSNLG